MGEPTGTHSCAGVSRVPVPVIFGSVDFFAGAGGEVGLEGHFGASEWALTPVSSSTSQSFGRADARGAGGLALQEKCGPVAHLGQRRVYAEIPDRRGDEVVAGLQR